MNTADFIVIGGGIIGLSTAREIRRKYPDAKVLLIEKERSCALHASGRNSGVIHAGFYYSADSLKARYTRRGNELLTKYCKERRLAIRQCGKLVVTRNQDELKSLDELLARAKRNGVSLKKISAKEAKSIEPRVKTFESALFSPTTSSIDPGEVLRSMEKDAEREGVRIRYGVAFKKKLKGSILTNQGRFYSGFVVNAAGLYADTVAREFGFSKNYRILPFKGLYLCSDEPAGSLKTNIYPVPDLRNPFLGVHFTVLADGSIKIGPTALPALWREQYGGFENFRFGEFLDVILREGLLFAFSDFDFKRLAVQEIKKMSRTRLTTMSKELLDGITSEKFTKWSRPGIRAQLVDIRKRRLEMDFVIEGDEKSIHILNAVSPALTCAIPIAQHVCERMDNRLK